MYKNDITEYSEDELLLLSGIQHFAFCRRQWALIHIEQQWEENRRTMEGRVLHDKVHGDVLSAEKRNDLIISRGMAVCSRRLGVTGVCDIVEFYAAPDGITLAGREGLWRPVPVEYKRGKPKDKTDADLRQLCCQAMCLEEMLLCSISRGYLFYGEIRHRLEVELTDDLRQRVRETLLDMHGYLRRRYTPKVKPSKACKECSLKKQCIPELGRNVSALSYIQRRIDDTCENS